jgi:hypothetical protein
VTCEEALESAAVALLTSDPLEADVEVHLASCAACRDELSGLAPLPSLLSMLDAGDFQPADATQPAGAALLDRLLAAAARERRRRRNSVLAIAAAVVLLLLVPAAVLVGQQLRHAPVATAAATPAQIDRSATDASTGVSGNARVWKSAWGSDLDVSISGVASGTRCTIVVVTTDGRQQTAATWVASYRGTAQVRGNVAAPVSSIARIDILDDSGKVLLRI